MLVPLELNAFYQRQATFGFSTKASLFVGLAGLAAAAAWDLRTGGRWGRWLACTATSLAIADSIKFLSDLYDIFKMLGPWTALLQAGELILARLPVVVVGLYVVYVLLGDRRARDWFTRARRIRQEFREDAKAGSS